MPAIKPVNRPEPGADTDPDIAELAAAAAATASPAWARLAELSRQVGDSP
jgi:hypothetical protein